MLKRKRPKLGLHTRLANSGWFQGGVWEGVRLSAGIGPFGLCPVQLYGRLVNGEFVYFRARYDLAEMEIRSTPKAKPHRQFSVEVRADTELGAGGMPVDEAVELIETWLTEYLGPKPDGRQEAKRGRWADWWSSVGDKQVFGIQLCFSSSAVSRLSLKSGSGMLHNGNRPVFGVLVQIGKFVLQLSSAASWKE